MSSEHEQLILSQLAKNQILNSFYRPILIDKDDVKFKNFTNNAVMTDQLSLHASPGKLSNFYGINLLAGLANTQLEANAVRYLHNKFTFNKPEQLAYEKSISLENESWESYLLLSLEITKTIVELERLSNFRKLVADYNEKHNTNLKIKTVVLTDNRIDHGLKMVNGVPVQIYTALNLRVQGRIFISFGVEGHDDIDSLCPLQSGYVFIEKKESSYPSYEPRFLFYNTLAPLAKINVDFKPLP